MNRINVKNTVLCIALGAAAHAHASEAAVPNRPPMRVAPTNEDLLLQLRKQEQAAPPVLKAPPSEDTAKHAVVSNLLAESTVLCYGGALSLVPKRAVLQCPKKYEDRLKPVRGAKVLMYSDFFAANRSWITSLELSQAQIEGAEPLPDKVSEQLSKAGNLVIATFRGNPVGISNNSPILPKPEDSTTQSQLPQP